MAAPDSRDATSDDEEEEEIQAIYNLELSESSRVAYHARLRLFVNYLRRTDPDLVLGTDDDAASFDCARLSLKQVELFLIEKQDQDGVGLDTLKGYRTALLFAYHESKVEFPVVWTQKLRRFFRGLRRKEAQERQDGTRPATTGKASMPHRLYVWLCEHFLRQGNVFSWTYLTLAWNSLCRAGNVSDVKLVHLEPLQDALGLRVPKSKADQDGARAKVAWSIAANSDDPRQCTVTALALLLLLDETRASDDKGGGKLFLGGSQERRFAHDLRNALQTEDGKAKMRECGRVPGSITPHSTRKGGAVFASSGTTHAPSFTAVTQRAGWSMGAILKRYFHFDASGDAYLGRVLAGLDVSSPRFAVLPPHFAPNVVSDAQLLRCFPAFRSRTEFLGVLRFLLPSLLAHHDALVKLLPANHRAHSTGFFMDAALRKTLAAHVVTGLDSPHMAATGIPPHVLMLRQGAGISAQIDRLAVHLVPTAAAPPQAPAPAPAPEAHVAPVKRTASGFPADFELPVMNPFGAWRLLVRGNKAQDWPPLCLLRPEEFPGNTALRKRISDLLYFYRTLLSNLDDDDLLSLDQLEADDDEARMTELFHTAWAACDFASLPGKTTARPDQWKLATAILKMRERARLARGAGNKRPRHKRTPIKETPPPAEEMEEEPEEGCSPPRKLFAVPKKRDMVLDDPDDEGENTVVVVKQVPVAKPNALNYSLFF